MRVRSGVFAGLIASLALLGACAREPLEAAYYEETPPPAEEAYEPVDLAGGPSREAERTVGQAEDDAYIASLASKGLIAERRIDPDTGESVLVVSNRPIPNPVLFGGPEHRRPLVRQSGRKGGRMAPAPVRETASLQSGSEGRAASPSPAATPVTAAAAPAPAAPEAQTAATLPVNAAPLPAESQPAAEPQPRFRMTSVHWTVLGLALLALLGLIYAAARPKKRASYSGHRAPPEASGGEAHA